MPSDDVLLPKHVSDSCYTSLTQIYMEIFKLPVSSNSRTKSSLKKAVINKTKLLSPDRTKKLKDPIDMTVIPHSETASMRSLEISSKNHKYRASWHLGQSNQIKLFGTVDFATQF